MNYEDIPTHWIWFIIKRLRSGEDIPHQTRFVLVKLLIQMNYTIDEIVPIFMNVPDFNERVTYYQIEHIMKNNESL